MRLQGPPKEKRQIPRQTQLQGRWEHELHELSWANITDKVYI